LPLTRRRRLPWLAVAGLAAAVLVGMAIYSMMLPRASAEPTLGDVLKKTAEADSLHAKLVQDGETGEVWVRKDRLRRDHANGTYEIATPRRLSVIDEKDNRVTPKSSPYFRGTVKPEVDLLSLVGLTDPKGRGQLEKILPAGRARENGAEYLVYRAEVPGRGGKLEVEALVDPGTFLLHSARVEGPAKGQKPLAELTVVAYDADVDAGKFVVKDTLTEDGRVGKVADVQGVVSLKPVLGQRWTPVDEDTLLRTGDWVRTDARGANAVLLRMVKQTTLTLGPGTLVEVVGPTQARVHQGEVEVHAPAGEAFDLVALSGQSFVVKGTMLYRVEEGRVARLTKEPVWLTGFKGIVPQESIGSLVAKVDGRDEPLTVGYHKVTVDIRDQIARTTIEESFVNHTDFVLEGVFHFPLPQDASISGFGMWIGDNLVEADVVEKQRAREIYETILTEKRDPGLLEWTGGNVFKARVYPIPGQGEKRIKITYTQVLPLRDGRYRYSYALQSEMLKQHPLRQLDIDVKVSSALSLKSVGSPTHTTRNEVTQHAAHVEYSAQEYTPTRDFEVVVEVDGAQQRPVVVVPHRRGDDGYFMLQLLPPGTETPGERTLLPDAGPLRLLVLADTSASMDATQRAQQAEFVAALLGSLTPRDTVNLGCCDVECDWAFERPVPAGPASVLAARQFLANRVSLGWTDLDRAFASALRQCEPGTQIVYIGDGIVTAGDADPAAFAKRLRRLYDEHGRDVTCHAVAVGSTFEPGVMAAVGALGGGSIRHVTGEQGPVAAARELLTEVARPGLRDVKVEFKGVRTARVYPDVLPNLPAGSQQIILGRYLPEGKDQSGEVIVTGRLDNKPIRWTAPITLKDAEQGNSFIPRLWARMHLDRLLAQGTSPVVRDEVIGLSEEYQIITPYTSLLVLESDADRARFGVKRTFHMRDGEKFFAEGRDNGNYELLQKQMKRAGAWRLGLRRLVVRQLAALGRNPQALLAVQGIRGAEHWSLGLPLSSSAAPTYFGSGIGGRYAGRREVLALEAFDDAEGLGAAPSGSASGPVDSMPLGDALSEKDALMKSLTARESDTKAERRLDAADETPEPQAAAARDEFAGADKPAASEPEDSTEREVDQPEGNKADKQLRDFDENAPVAGKTGLPALNEEMGEPLGFDYGRLSLGGERAYRSVKGMSRVGQMWLIRGPAYPDPRPSFDSLFPQLPVPALRPKAVPSSWPAAARDVARSILRTERLAALTGGIEVMRRTEVFDAPRARLTDRARRLELFAPGNWLTRAEDDRSATLVNWCDGHQRGVFSLAFQLGRVRAAAADEARIPPLDLSDSSLTPLDQTYADRVATVEKEGKDRAVLVLTNVTAPAYATRVTVDTARRVVLQVEHRANGKATTTSKFSEFVQAADCWWACRMETLDDQGHRTALSTQTVKEMTPEAFRLEVARERAAGDAVQFLHEPLPRVADAKRAQQVGKASFGDRVALLRHFAASQQWTRAREELDKAEEIAAGKPGMRWLRDAFLSASRRHEELKPRLLAEAEELARKPGGSDTSALTEHLISQANSTLSIAEAMTLHDRLRPAYEARPAHVRAMEGWTQQRVNYLQHLGRPDDALRLQKQLAVDYADDMNQQRQYAQAVANTGDYDAAYGWLTRVLKEGRWTPDEDEALRDQYAALLYQQGRYDDLVSYFADWLKRQPESKAPYLPYLSALVRTGQPDKANGLIAGWLKEGQVQCERPPLVEARFQAAISQALGRGHNLYTYRIDDPWLAPLADVVLYLAQRPADLPTADTIMQSTFGNTDECRAVRKKVRALLAAEVDKLTPEQLQHFVSWSLPDEPSPAPAYWKQIADGLHKRWSAETRPDARNRLGEVLAQVLSNRATAAELLAFLHRQLREGPEAYRPAHAQKLFETLLAQPWSVEYEDEALALLDQTWGAEGPHQQLHARVVALYRLTDRIVAARYEALMAKVKQPENLTRTELRKKQEEARKQSRAAYADRLRQEIDKHGKTLAPWLTAECVYLDVRLGRDPKRAAAECWAILGDAPPATAEEPDSPVEAVGQLLDGVLRRRLLTTLADLAARKDADPALVKRLLAYVDRGLAAEGEAAFWRSWKYRLLLALDRPKELEQALRQWTAADEANAGWRVALGFLLAEEGRLAEAVAQLEAAEKADELGPAAYRALADWYLVLNRRAQRERALVAAYRTLDEYHLYRLINARLSQYQRGDGQAPAELDAEIPLMFLALFEKSGNPNNYLWQLQQFYQATRDFRLLAVLPDAVVGQSAGKVYPFLQAIHGIVADIHDEATVDELCAHLEQVRGRAKTAVDRRALDLLETEVQRRGAELKNQPGPHTEAALSALKRAFKYEWSDGEPRLMADLLAALGSIPQQPLAQEQLRQLAALHQAARAGSEDRLHIAQDYATVLWNYGRRDEATDHLIAGLNEFQDANNGVLPVSANPAVVALVSFHEASGHYDRAETYLRAQLQHPVHHQQDLWLRQAIDGVYVSALRGDGEVSLGKGQALYEALERNLRDALATDDHDHRVALVGSLCQTYRAGADKRLAGPREDLRAFAFKGFADVLRRQTSNYENVVNEVAGTVHDILGPGEAVLFLLDRVENEPAWFRFNNQDGWSRHSWQLGQWLTEAKTLPPEADARLLKFVLAELRRDLETRQQRNRVLYYRQYSYYWADKEPDFAKAAEEVLDQHKMSAATVVYIAEYLSRGCNRHALAVAALLDAHRAKVLEESGEALLAQYLQEAERYGDSIPVLLPLVKERPENLSYRVLLMRAYFKTGRQQELTAQLRDADAFFHQKGRWTEEVMATLARSTLETQLFNESVAYFKKVIGLQERTAPRRGIGDGVLSEYYSGEARAYAGLGKTPEAVDAACGAVVSWGPTSRNRAAALESLRQVLHQAKDLDGYVQYLDRQATETRQDNALVRKAVGQVYADKHQHAQAIRQLRLAAEMQPNDAETHRLLVGQFDALQDPEGAFRQLLESAQLARRDIKLYQEMGKKLEALGRPREVERAYTSVVEMLPNESEGHALLAEIRQGQNRWPEAITEWEQVARIRALEPTGMLKLAAAQVHERQWDGAAETVKKLRSRAWPARFGNVDQEAAALEQQIHAGRKAGS
jgi:predicted Zn-dependent protease